MKIARVFPRRTKATPSDELAFIGDIPELFLQDIDEVHISVTFTYDKPRAEELAFQLDGKGVLVKLGGPAYDDPGGEFVPGMYVKKGYVMTSRGCNNRCWFCSVWRREGPIREIPISEGNNVMDSNLLQCSDEHINAVFDMLKRQKYGRPLFTGGLEARILKSWHCKRLKEINAAECFFAYDTPDDLEPLIEAGRMMMDAGFAPKSHVLCCYCLIGYKGDTFEAAEKRMMQAIKAGFMPYAMLYRDEKGETDLDWRRFQRIWVRREFVSKKFNEVWW
jgi:hypothetical protein